SRSVPDRSAARNSIGQQMESDLVPVEWAFVGGPATGAVSGLGDDGSGVAVGEELPVIFQAGHCRLATLPRAEKVQQLIAGEPWRVLPSPAPRERGLGFDECENICRHGVVSVGNVMVWSSPQKVSAGLRI